MSVNSSFPVGYQPAQITYTPVMYPQPAAQPQSNVPTVSQNEPVQPYTPVFQPKGSNMLMVDGRHVVEKWVLDKGETMVFFDRNKDAFYVKSVSEQGMPFPIEECTFKRKVDGEENEQPVPEQQPKYVTSAELDEKFKLLHKEIFDLLNESGKKEANDNGKQLIV